MPYLVHTNYSCFYLLCMHSSAHTIHNATSSLCATLSSPSALRVHALLMVRRVSTSLCCGETIFQPEIFLCKCFFVIVFSLQHFQWCVVSISVCLFSFLRFAGMYFLQPLFSETSTLNSWWWMHHFWTHPLCVSPLLGWVVGGRVFAPTRCCTHPPTTNKNNVLRF